VSKGSLFTLPVPPFMKLCETICEAGPTEDDCYVAVRGCLVLPNIL
jgi:hypothetical protein